MISKKERIGIFTLSLLISIILFSSVSCKKREKEYKTYSVFGNAYEMQCSQRDQFECGIRLSNCKDGRQYDCLQNVMQENGH
jgi:hypothetical protein